MTHYEVLGVEPHASLAELRQAYHREARRWHPDFAGPTPSVAAQDRMQMVNEAWRVLSDSHLRRRYDNSLDDGSSRGRSSVVDDEDDEAWWAERERWIPAEGSTPRRPMVFAPVGLFGMGVVLGILNSILAWPALFAFAVVCVVLSAVLFVIAPFLVMLNAKKETVL